MAKNILNPKIQATGLVDIGLIGVSKNVTERMLTPVIGNGTLQSGIMKLVAGGFVQGQAGKLGSAVGGGLVIDAVDDIVGSLMGGMGGSGATSEDW